MSNYIFFERYLGKKLNLLPLPDETEAYTNDFFPFRTMNIDRKQF